MAGIRSGQTLLCDVDGTLFNSWDWLVNAVYHTAETLGFSAPSELVVSNFYAGISLQDFYAAFAPHIDINECMKVHREYQARNMDLITLFPGVRETLQELHGAGVKLGIVTSRKSRDSLIGTLQKMNVHSFFEVIVCLEDVSLPKPDPAGVLLALKKLRTRKEGAFFVGDTVADIEAGKNAKIETIGALYGFGGEALRKANAAYYIESFSEIIPIIFAKNKRQ